MVGDVVGFGVTGVELGEATGLSLGNADGCVVNLREG